MAISRGYDQELPYMHYSMYYASMNYVIRVDRESLIIPNIQQTIYAKSKEDSIV